MSIWYNTSPDGPWWSDITYREFRHSEINETFLFSAEIQDGGLNYKEKLQKKNAQASYSGSTAPKDPKYAWNRCISNGFQVNRHFQFQANIKYAAKILKINIYVFSIIQDGSQNSENKNFFIDIIYWVCSTLRAQYLLNITLSATVFQDNQHFQFIQEVTP